MTSTICHDWLESAPFDKKVAARLTSRNWNICSVIPRPCFTAE